MPRKKSSAATGALNCPCGSMLSARSIRPVSYTHLDVYKRQILNRMPLHAYGDTRDLGKMAEFLVGDGAAYITGQDFAVDRCV